MPVFNLTERRSYYNGGFNYWTDITVEHPGNVGSLDDPHHIYGVSLEAVGSDYMVGHTLHGLQVASRDQGQTWQATNLMFRCS